MPEIVWSDYVRFRAELRGFDLDAIADILRYSPERYRDTETGRFVAVGRCVGRLVAVPYERDRDLLCPVTVHATTRQQVRFRLRTGRYAIDE